MPEFEAKLERSVRELSSDPMGDPQENEFIDASRLVYDGVREIRRAVLMIKDPEDIEDSDYEEVVEGSLVGSRITSQVEEDEILYI